jgi:hypothetical protein
MIAHLVITLALSLSFGFVNRGPWFTREGSWQKKSWRDIAHQIEFCALSYFLIGAVITGVFLFGWLFALMESTLAFALINLPEALRTIKQKIHD